ncbi:MAG TPA: ATP-binding cassette domain-containing protein [Agitococcus sp.]|nr:ATP-binding cassette domain-containing protein [Agitococcus sp.]
MSLLSFRAVSLSFGGPLLLKAADFSLDQGERVCILGRNGEGKSSLFKLLTGENQPDSGEITRQQGLVVASLSQEVPSDLTGDVFDIVAAGLGEAANLLQRYHHLSHACELGDNQACMELANLQSDMDSQDCWSLQHKVEQILNRMELDGNASLESLSGGRKRRVMLARALVQEPNILLLDEPTNHLDVSSIQWLENFLASYTGTVLFISHDRAFIERIATRIVELDRGILRSFNGGYQQYLVEKPQLLEAEAKQNAVFDKKLAEEEVWIRQGIKARRTRNEGRVRALIELRRERVARRERVGNAQVQIQEAEKSGKLVFDIKNLTVKAGDKTLVKDFTAMVMRGDKIGLLGENGVGKTSLIRVLLGENPPSAGTVHLGTKIEVAYFDQLRNQLDEEKTVLDNIAHGSEFLEINGERKHALSYLQDFLFSAQRSRTPVKALSGGERNRVLLARLFSRPSNVLVMDEPTNDLDIETLELLEERLAAYQGTLLLISHDRAFLDNVVTDTWAFMGDAVVEEFVGGYQDWLRQTENRRVKTNNKTTNTMEKTESAKPVLQNKEKPTNIKRKLSYNEQRELEALPSKIAALEQEQQLLQDKLNDSNFYVNSAQEAVLASQRLATIDEELLTLLERWTELES